MEPKIISQRQMLIAGVSGLSNQTAQTWAAYRQISKTTPLNNKSNEYGYEIRLYSENGEAEVHIGMCVNDANVPEGYQVMSLPAALYAEFKIFPAKGYTSSNQEMERWLSASPIYNQERLDGKRYSVLVYDSRYKGEKDPASVVACWIPVKPNSTEIIARCGNACHLCSAYAANVHSDEDKQKVSDVWEKYFGFFVPPEMIYCAGCIDSFEPGDKDCPVRPCAMQKDLANCGYCQDFPCDRLKTRVQPPEKLAELFSKMPPEDYDKFVKPGLGTWAMLTRINSQIRK
jgi:predicted transcriptional regulator YdeE